MQHEAGATYIQSADPLEGLSTVEALEAVLVRLANGGLANAMASYEVAEALRHLRREG